MFHNMGYMAPSRNPGDRPGGALLVQVVESAAAARRSASSRPRAGLPKSTTSRLVGALERQGLVQRTATAARCSPGRCSSASPQRDGAAEPGRARRADARAASPTRPARRSTWPSPERSAPSTSPSATARTSSASRTGSAAACRHHVAANGKVFMAFGAARCPTSSSASPRDDLDRAELERQLEPCAPRLRDGRRRARARPGGDGRARAAAGRRALRGALDLGPDHPPHPRPHRAARAAPDRRRRPRSRRGSATTTTSEVPHDPRRDPPGPLRQHARRQRARGARPRRAGPRGRHGARDRCSTTR